MAARKTDPKPAGPETIVEKIEDICRACWPNGWPHLSHSASCEHGTYVRELAAAEPEQTPASGGDTKTPEGATEKKAEDQQ